MTGLSILDGREQNGGPGVLERAGLKSAPGTENGDIGRMADTIF
jgi:hypothetical protein